MAKCFFRTVVLVKEYGSGGVGILEVSNFVAVDLIGISGVGPGFNGGMNVMDKILF